MSPRVHTNAWFTWLPFKRNRRILDLLALNLNRHLLDYLSATFSMSCKEFGANGSNDISSASKGQILATVISFVHIDDCCISISVENYQVQKRG